MAPKAKPLEPDHKYVLEVVLKGSPQDDPVTASFEHTFAYSQVANGPPPHRTEPLYDDRDDLTRSLFQHLKIARKYTRTVDAVEDEEGADEENDDEELEIPEEGLFAGVRRKRLLFPPFSFAQGKTHGGRRGESFKKVEAGPGGGNDEGWVNFRQSITNYIGTKDNAAPGKVIIHLYKTELKRWSVVESDDDEEELAPKKKGKGRKGAFQTGKRGDVSKSSEEEKQTLKIVEELKDKWGAVYTDMHGAKFKVTFLERNRWAKEILAGHASLDEPNENVKLDPVKAGKSTAQGGGGASDAMDVERWIEIGATAFGGALGAAMQGGGVGGQGGREEATGGKGKGKEVPEDTPERLEAFYTQLRTGKIGLKEEDIVQIVEQEIGPEMVIRRGVAGTRAILAEAGVVVTLGRAEKLVSLAEAL